MALSEAQAATLQAHILANTDPVIVQAVADADNNTIRAWYNDPDNQTPDRWAIKPVVPTVEVFESLDPDTDYANLAVKDLQALSLLFTTVGVAMDPTKANIRSWLAEILASAPTSRGATLLAIVRLASPAEALFLTAATGPGGGDGTTPATSALLGFAGPLTIEDMRLVFPPS